MAPALGLLSDPRPFTAPRRTDEPNFAWLFRAGLTPFLQNEPIYGKLDSCQSRVVSGRDGPPTVNLSPSQTPHQPHSFPRSPALVSDLHNIPLLIDVAEIGVNHSDQGVAIRSRRGVENAIDGLCVYGL